MGLDAVSKAEPRTLGVCWVAGVELCTFRIPIEAAGASVEVEMAAGGARRDGVSGKDGAAETSLSVLRIGINIETYLT